MALPKQLVDFVETNGDSLQNMALLAYLKQGESAKPFLETVTAAKVAVDTFKLLSGEDKMEAARNETILRIATYVKEHPRARPQELQQKVEEEITLFKLKIQTL